MIGNIKNTYTQTDHTSITLVDDRIYLQFRSDELQVPQRIWRKLKLNINFMS